MISNFLNYFVKDVKRDEVVHGSDRNIALLEQMGIYIENDNSIRNSGFDQFLSQSKKHIAERAYILYFIYMVSSGQIDAQEAIKYLETHSIFFKLTKKEYEFLYQHNYELNTDFTWRIERIWILLWVLKKVDFSFFSIQTCCTTTVNKAFYQKGFLIEPDDFIKSCVEFRDKIEVQALLDLYLRLNWYAVENKLKGQQVQQFNDRIVYERLYALQWVTQNKKLKWDESDVDFFQNI